METNIGDKQAFPTTFGGLGITYREWLIGQALMGMAANPAYEPVNKTSVNNMLRLVDILLEAVEQEEIELEEKRQREKSEDLPI